MIVKTQAIVLKTMDYRETSRIAHFFTKENGKVSGVLKGIRKDHRKFGSSLERFSVNDIVYYQYRNSDLHLISQCDCREDFFPIRQDLKKMTAAMYVLELVQKIMPSEARNIPVYQLMNDFFQALSGTDDVTPLIHLFQVKMLSCSGFRPHLDSCLKCRRTVNGQAWFSARDGGLVCTACNRGGPAAQSISAGAVATILYVERNVWESCLKLKMVRSVREELKYILNNFLVFHLGKNIRSARYV